MRHEFSGRCEDQGSVKKRRRRFRGAARPGAAERTGEVLPCRVAVPREGIYRALLMPGDLRQYVRGGAKAIKAYDACRTGQPQCPPPDQARAEEGGSFHIRKVIWQVEAISRIGYRMARIAAVPRGSGEERGVA